MTSPETFESMRDRAVTMLQTAFMSSGRAWPVDKGTLDFIRIVLGVGIAAASEHYAQHPEHLALAGNAVCAVCKQDVRSWQVGIDPALQDSEQLSDPVMCAWPCGHIQPSPSSPGPEMPRGTG